GAGFASDFFHRVLRCRSTLTEICWLAASSRIHRPRRRDPSTRHFHSGTWVSSSSPPGSSRMTPRGSSTSWHSQSTLCTYTYLHPVRRCHSTPMAHG